MGDAYRRPHLDLTVHLAMLCLCACTGSSAFERATPTAPASAPTLAIDYSVGFDEGLRRAEVELCFTGPPPAALVPGQVGDDARVTDVSLRAPGARPRPVAIRAGLLDLSGAESGACVAYRVYLGDAVTAFGDAWVVPNGAWLWRPPRSQWSRLGPLSLRFSLPDGYILSQPWQRGEDGVYHTDASAFAFISRAVVGRFDQIQFDSAGARFHVALLPGMDGLRERVVPWLRSASQAVASVGGRFPASRVQVILLPGGFGSGPLGFSMVARGGGASVTFRVNPTATLSALQADWTAVHEFSHLWLPFVRRSDAWLSEGLATYLQEVLRVRVGLHDEGQAWARLASGAERGVDASESLAAGSRTMYRDFSFRRIYWGGAAFWLLADVELRRTGGQSLDHALSALQEGHPRPLAALPASELLATLDQVTGTRVFEQLARRTVYRAPYPNLSPVLTALGVSVADGAVTLQQGAPLSELRRAIMAPVAAPSASN